ncbi:MAG: hypothetical protein A3G81_26890 [Betaproteobacteria bacterium RIFCSPLOWO2_12_FULL_65_14]|nr:MAG: hypothetical protein A3G81_26890 [Betaproteobacteria bacterium RIFCSPLOWO2_12_FULL_65_14]
MLKAAAAVSILAAGLAACASRGPDAVSTSGATAPGGGIVTQTLPYRPGAGVVQRVSRAPNTREPLSMLAIRMDDGRMQYIDTASDIPVGSRVQLTPDHKIIRQ